MIIAKLVGGLGNQMFQYALARCLAYRLGTILKLDITSYRTAKLRKYGLCYFNITERFVNLYDLIRINNSHRISPRLTSWLFGKKPMKVITQKNFSYDSSIFDIDKGTDVYLDGYWQSEKYFIDIEDIIRKEFTVKNALSGKSKELAGKIANSTSVSLHVRRKDYVDNEITHRHHGICSYEYYEAAIDKIAESVVTPNFFVFSDDIDWAKKNIHAEHPVTFVNNNGNKDYEDLRLISMCKHHIIANSSFSWWGAWLCENHNKIIYAPQKWFNTASRDLAVLIPSKWHRL
ncbi:MAG: alpha-1,2-fucosyltransferase [Candidatus Omnitrophica bacterium]|nr:alpha-1,2-fucosyltransferase [Candidatus Omnitrophota bacterium]